MQICITKSTNSKNCKGEKIWLIHQRHGTVETQSPLKTSTTSNKASQIVGGGTEPLVVRFDHDDGNRRYYDKTWQEIHDAMPLVVIVTHGESVDDGDTTTADAVDAVSEVSKIVINNVDSEYTVRANHRYHADSADGYIYFKGIE